MRRGPAVTLVLLAFPAAASAAGPSGVGAAGAAAKRLSRQPVAIGERWRADD
jgi:hypothetical protein